ncbi:MAG: glycosyltransferase [Ignavibacteria bacterium]|nr:glycosyltransferase [Ignavibacteria bacterium]
MINIVFFGSFIYPHGMAATKRKQQFLEYCLSAGANVFVLNTFQVSDDSSALKNEIGTINLVPYKILCRNPRKHPSLVFEILKTWLQAFKIIKSRKNNDQNVLVGFGVAPLTLPVFLFAKLLGYKVVFDVVEDYDEFLSEGKDFIGAIYLKISKILNSSVMLSIADAIVVISNRLKEKYQQTGIKKLTLIPVSAHVSEIVPKKEFAAPVTFVYSGTFGEKEGLEYLIQAFKMLANKNTNVRLLLTGKAKKNRIQYFTGMIQDCPAIKYVGMLPDDEFYTTLRTADVLCMTRVNSQYANAGFPYKLGEYLATGNPVLATSVSDIPLYLEHLKDAYLAEPENAEDLLRGMEYILADQSRAIQMGLNGYAKCREYFDENKNSKTFLEVVLNTAK